MTIPAPVERCSKRVSDKTGVFTHPCPNKATTTENGKPYCTIHAPSYIREKRNAKRDAKWAAREEAQAKANLHARQASLFPELVEAAKEALEILETIHNTYHVSPNMWVKLTIAFAKARALMPEVETPK